MLCERRKICPKPKAQIAAASSLPAMLRSLAGRVGGASATALSVRPASTAACSAAPAARAFSSAAAPAASSPILSRLRDPTLFKTQCYIDGQWVGKATPSPAAAAAPVTDHTHHTINVRSPTSGEPIGTIPRFGAKETHDAIAAASRAFPLWAGLTAKARSDYLMKWYNLCMQHKDDLATILTMEQGKPFAEAQGEVSRGQEREGGERKLEQPRRARAHGWLSVRCVADRLRLRLLFCVRRRS